MKFQYFEIRPCVSDGDETRSFLGEPEFIATIGDRVCTPLGALAEAQAYCRSSEIDPSTIFWTIYGRDEENHAVAVGDFGSRAAADEVMNAILAPMAAARDLIQELGAEPAPDGSPWKAYERAAHDLDDFINQCSNGDRI